MPRKPTKNNPATRIYAIDEPTKWQEFRDVYLKADVDTMEAIVAKLGLLSPFEQQVWIDTQKINLSGVPIDIDTVRQIQGKLDSLIDLESSKFIRIVGLFPTQRDKILQWVKSKGCKIDNLQAATVEALINNPSTPQEVIDAMVARGNTTHMSFKKFTVMENALCKDQTIKGTLMYHAAGTGRFGGRLLQTQNLTKGNIDGEEAVTRIHNGEFDVELVKSAVRPMIHHKDGMTISDYAGIEARVVQWLAQDSVALQVFHDGLDPYKWMAEKIYGVPYDKVTSKQRFTGKQAILGLGYQMSAKKFISMVESYGETIEQDEAQLAVNTYRGTHRKLVNFWSVIEEVAKKAVTRPDTMFRVNKYISFMVEEDFLYMILPCDRDWETNLR
jgi:DNA polymerase